MTYKVKFLPTALKEMRALTPDIRAQFKQQLIERTAEPHHAASQLYGFKNVFKIRLPGEGFRLVYSINDADSLIYVIAVGRPSLNPLG
jgi:mRNA interferase RelE/StbE